METHTLNCWVRGTDVRSIFEVKISGAETVAALKEAIKNKNPAAFRDVDAVTLRLYKPRKPVPRPYKDNFSEIILSEDGETWTSTRVEACRKKEKKKQYRKKQHSAEARIWSWSRSEGEGQKGGKRAGGA